MARCLIGTGGWSGRALGITGYVSHRQLTVIGFDKSAIARRVGEGRLTLLHRGVYLVGPPPPTLHGKWLAAVIASDDGAVLSHRHGAMLWDVRRTDRASVTVAGNARRRRDGITIHRTRSLHPDDITTIDGILVASAERTLLDLAEVVTSHQLQRAYEQAEKLRVIDHAALRSLVARSTGRRGLKHLPLLDYDPTPASEAWSELERRFHDLVPSLGSRRISETSWSRVIPHRSTPTGRGRGSSSSYKVTSSTPARKRSNATTRSVRG